MDLKLALYSLFPRRIPNGGVFLCSSDTIELFDESTNDVQWTIDEDFVAFAHPSSLEIGTQHGVYVLDENSTDRCRCILQKPTIEMMKNYGAIVNKSGEQIVYTDSLYFFNLKIARRFAEIYRSQKEIRCEIDCYGDFMSPLGRQPLDRPLVNDQSCQAARLKQIIYDSLLGSQLKLIILNDSSFHHTGTNDEYLDICCAISPTGQHIFDELKLEQHVACKVFDETKHDTVDFWNGFVLFLHSLTRFCWISFQKQDFNEQ